MNKKKVTIADISKATNVSPATVSRVLNHPELVKEETIALVKKAMLDLGCNTNKIADKVNHDQMVIVLNLPSDQNIFYQDVLRGATVSAKAHGCYLLIQQSPIDHGTIHSFCNLLHRVRAAGVILLNQIPADLLDQIQAVAPLVQCCEYNKDTSYPYVSIDDVFAAKNATEYLLSCGRNKISFVNGPIIYKYAVDRKQGFLEAIKEADVTIPKNWLVQLPEINYKMAYTAVCRILNSDTVPNAFFAASDILAMAIIRAIKRYHFKVPRDIMVVGFDNIEFCSITVPSITTVSQPRFQMGYSACEILIEMLLNPASEVKSILLDTELVIRESTSANYLHTP